ncbi:MAG: type II toxin-antitoxin system VapC family toxin [Candidatus Heimdallarchaeota archaeon]
MLFYLDTNVFYHAYCPVEDSSSVEWLFSQFSKICQGITCEWTILEMFRAFKKQVNLGVINEKDAQIALDFFIADISEMSKKSVLQLIPITMTAIITTRKLIFSYNLFAADALHATIAINSQVNAFITYDENFKVDLDEIPILNPQKESFRSKIEEILHRKQ